MENLPGETTKEKFLNDHVTNGSAMFFLAQGIETITNIGSHILEEAFHISPDSYRKIIEQLGETKVIPKKFAETNASMTSFRNIIIHAYANVDLNQVYNNLQKTPNIFREFSHYYIKFLKKV